MRPLDVSSAGTADNGNSPSNGLELAALETPSPKSQAPGMPVPSSLGASPKRDPYRSVVLVLLVAAIVGLAGALEAGWRLENPVLIDSALTLGLAAGILIGVARTQAARLRPPKESAPKEATQASTPEPEAEGKTSAGAPDTIETIRAGATTLLHEAGVAAAVAQALIGHDSEQIHNDYINVGRDALKNAVAKLPRIL